MNPRDEKQTQNRRYGWISIVILFLAIPFVILMGWKLGNDSVSNRYYYVTATIVLLLAMVPFFLHFEGRRPTAGEITLLAILCALTIASRAVFAFAPNIKPMMAFVMLAGIAYGPETGFLCGALSMGVSNFLFGQGPWTPWQMMAFGIGGFFAGICIPRIIPSRKVPMAVFGTLFVLVIAGPLLDTATLFLGATEWTKASVWVVYQAGFFVNLVHGLTTGVTLLLVGEPILERLERVKVKYGMLGGR